MVYRTTAIGVYSVVISKDSIGWMLIGRLKTWTLMWPPPPPIWDVVRCWWIIREKEEEKADLYNHPILIRLTKNTLRFVYRRVTKINKKILYRYLTRCCKWIARWSKKKISQKHIHVVFVLINERSDQSLSKLLDCVIFMIPTHYCWIRGFVAGLPTKDFSREQENSSGTVIKKQICYNKILYY